MIGNWKKTFHEIYELQEKEPGVFYARIHDLRQAIYDETIDFVQKGSYPTNGGKIALPDCKPMMENSILYQDPGKVDVPACPGSTIVEVVESDTLLAGRQLLNEGYNPAVLNFANRQIPGGGVLDGCGAQEENIFRRSNLFASLYQYHDVGRMFGIPQQPARYPMDRNTGGAYTPNITVFRDTEDEGYALLEQPYQLSVVTVAAINRPPLNGPSRLADRMVEPTRQKIRTIYRIALLHGHDSMVLGAWGCGAFRNPPQHIAKLFHEVMNEPEFANRFRKIVFAIMKRHGVKHGVGNFERFQAEFAHE